MDYQYAKRILLDEYLEQGGKHATDFEHGMNYLQDYIESERDERRLQDEVPMVEHLNRVRNHLSVMNERHEFLVAELKKEIKSLNKELYRVRTELDMYKSMSKKERKLFRSSQAFKDMQTAYSRMVSELHGVKDGKCYQIEINESLNKTDNA